MKNMSFKLTRRELVLLSAFVSAAHRDNSKEPLLRMVHHGLGEMLHKLLLAMVIFKQDYKISLSTSSCLALLAFWGGENVLQEGYDQALVTLLSDGETTNVIRRIAGIIDQKTI